VIEATQLAERLGYHTFWITDSHLAARGAWPAWRPRRLGEDSHRPSAESATWRVPSACSPARSPPS
jgi:alkanesulfonate monooxygenase SsuD/methylene tetrahydromethanopterin reductase-like flavin-dependent oxidoreductase (luciferase family)